MSNWYEGWTDVTYPIFDNMTGWPGQPDVSHDVLSCIHCGDEAQVSMLHLSAHTGTHVDAPNHFMAQGTDVSRIPITAGLGPVRIANIPCTADIEVAHLEDYERRSRPLAAGERLICRTPNSDRPFWPQEPFNYDYHAVGPDAARWIADRGLLMIGVDYLSIGPFKTTPYTHRNLMRGGVWILEGVDLRRITEGDYDMICLPLKFAGADGAPARVLLRPRAGAGKAE